MRGLTPKKYAAGLYEALQDVKQEQIPDVLKAFVKILARKKDLSKASKIISAFIAYSNQKENKVEVSVTSVKPLSDQERSRIISQLKDVLEKDIVLSEETDESLIAGAVVRYGDVVVNGSISNRLELLSDTLKK